MQLAPNRKISAISQPGSTIYESLDARGFPAQPRLVIMPLSVMLVASWETDAHFVTYEIQGIEDPDASYRVKKEAVEGLEAIGHQIVTTAVGIDLDLKDMGFGKDVSWNDLDADTANDLYKNVLSLALKAGANLAPFTAVYTGLRGFKLIHQLSEPIPVSAAEALILKFLNAYTAAGLPVDMQCKDWTRLFRAPRVVREDGIVTQDQPWFKLEFFPDRVYQVTEADKAARPMPKYKNMPAISGSPLAPDEAEALIWEFSEKGRKWTPLASKAEKLLRNTVLHAHVFGGTPLALSGNRHGALVTLVGGLCKVFAPHPEFTPEFIAALAMEATKLLEQDEDWRGKVWEQVTTFLTRDRARVPELPTILSKPAPSLPMPSGGEDDGDELQVISNLPPQIPPEPVGMPAFSKNPDNGQIYPTRKNFALALEHSRIVFWRDEFTGRDMILTPLQSQEITDDMELCVRMHLEDTYGIGIKSPEKWHEFVTWSAIKNAHHPARYYFDSLQWDGKPRLKGLFYDYFGSPPSLPPELSEQFATLIMVAAVRRIRYPGVKFDEVVVLEGDQGTWKSSALRALCPRPEWFCDDVSLDTDSKTLIEQTRGKLFVELAELSGGKKAQIDKMKAMLSRQTDRARAAYARRAEDIPRQFVFWASTNDAKYLRDHTGNRRFWPVPITKIDMKSLERDRDQLWAEAAALESKGLSIRLDPKLYVPAAQLASQRTTEDVFVQALAHHLAEFENEPNIAIRANDVWNMLGVERVSDRHALSSRFGEACKSLGLRGEQITRNGARVLHRVRGEADPRVVKFLKWNKQAEKLIPDKQNMTASVATRQPNVVLEQ